MQDSTDTGNAAQSAAASDAAARYAAHTTALTARWEDALATHNFAAAIIAAGTERRYFLDDQAPPWRPNPHLAQWLPGLECPGSSLLLVPGRRPQLFFLAPADYWHQPPSAPTWAQAVMDIRLFADPQELERALRQATGNARCAWIGEDPAAAPPQATANAAALLAHLHWQRAAKTAFELDCLRTATASAVRGHLAAAAVWREGGSEFAIQHAYLGAAGHTAAELPYPAIVAQNEHAGVLHYQHYDRQPPVVRRSFLIDAGATCRGYAADITRTWCATDAPDADRFAALVAALDTAQQAIIADIHPGLSYVDLHIAAHQRIGRILAEQGIARCSAEAAFDSGLTRIFLPHGLGHLLGLQTHDVGGLQADAAGTPAPPPAEYPALRLTRTIAADQVFTIEPGIYFIPLLLEEAAASPLRTLLDWDVIERLRPFGGIRIEDNIVVGDAGVENLTRAAFAREA